ncbi:serine protease [Phytohabitans houttuyneae]|nr:serine protease [Phytohabitans houttuyneae]
MADVVRASSVSLWDGEQFLGSGFFVEPHLVVTCAHVVWRRPDRIAVRWREHLLDGDVVVRHPPEHGGGDYYAHPDVAFVRVAAAPDHPVARLASDVSVPPELLAYGFSAATPDAGVAPDTLRLTVVGRSGQFLRLKDDEIVDGMSGSPALDPRTGLVYGLVKASRDYGGPRGGWIVQATDVALVRSSHAAVLGPPADPTHPRLRPAPGSALHDLLVAQRRAAERLPYRLVDGPAPPLSTIYVRQRAAPRYAGPRSDVPVRSVSEVLRRHRHTLVVGGPGAGKSALVQHIVAETAGWWLDGGGEAAAPYGPALTLRVPATAMLGRRPWLELLAGAVERDLSDYLDRGVDPQTLDPAATPGIEWLLLVDGLDEVYDRDQRQRLIDALGHRVAEYGSAWRFLVTSRPLFGAELAGLGAHLPDPAAEPRFGDYELRQFDPPGLRRFARAWFTVRTPERAENNATTFLEEVDHRRLDPLVRVPLLATIAAVVFEGHPDGPLPMSRTGLYERFVANLVYTRQRRQDLRQALTDQLAVYAPGATRVVDLLFDRTQEWLEEVAHHRLASGEETTTTALAQRWLDRQPGGAPEVPELARHLRAMLLGTGLLTVSGEDVRFIHRGFAEYLAAGYSVRHDWNEREWLRRVRRDGITNLDMFRLARWADAGNDAAPVLRRLLRVRPHARPPFVRRPQLLDFGTILRDGLPLPEQSVDGLVAAGFTAVRRLRVVDESALPALTYVLRCLNARSAGPARLVQLARDRRVAPIKRVAAARALIMTGARDDRRAAVDALHGIVTNTPPGDTGGLWATYTLALVGDADARRRAIGRLARDAVAEGDPESRVRATLFLAELGHGAIADQRLLVRAVSPSLPRSMRVEAVETLRLAGPASGGAPVVERLADVWQQFRAANLTRAGRLAATGQRAETETIDADDASGLAEGAARLADHDPAAAERILVAARAEGGLSDAVLAVVEERLTRSGHHATATAIVPEAETLIGNRPPAWEHAVRAVDRAVAAEERLEAAVALASYRAERQTAEWLQMAWHTDPAVPIIHKIEATLELARHRGHYDLANDLLRTHAGDRRLSRWQRLAARLGGVALDLDELTVYLSGGPPLGWRHPSLAWIARHSDPEQPVRRALLRGWLRHSGESTDALARAVAAASSREVAEALRTALSEKDDPAPVPAAPDEGDLASARRAMSARAESLRIVLAAGMLNDDWADRSLAASIGDDAADRADAALVEVVTDPAAAARHDRRLARARTALRCPWYARLLAEMVDVTGPQRAARLALGVALRREAEAYVAGRRRPVRLPSLPAWRAARQTLRRDATRITLAVLAAYATTFAGAAAALLGDGLLTVALVARVAEVQAQLALPVLVVLGCLLVRPARSLAAEHRTRLVLLAAGGLAAFMARPEAGTPLRVPAWPGIEDGLRRLDAFVVDHLPLASKDLALAVTVAGIVTAIAALNLHFATSAARRPTALRTAVRAVLLAATAWWVLALSPSDLWAAVRSLASVFASAGLP